MLKVAANDIYTSCTCKLCGYPVREIPLIDNWGDHVLSKYECINKECGMKISECDGIEVDDFVKMTFHRKE